MAPAARATAPAATAAFPSSVDIGQARGPASALAVAVRIPTDVGSDPAQAAIGPSAGVGPSGAAMPRGDLDGWRQIYADDFVTGVATGSFPAKVSGKWSAYPSPWSDTSNVGTYSPGRVVSVSGGVLNKYVRTDQGVPLIAAITPKLPGSTEHGVTYGRFAVRFRADSLPGYKIAWMLWPDSGQRNRDGEIDFPEMNLDSSTMFGYVHRTNATSGADQSWAKVIADVASWHTAVVEWSPGLVVFLLDDVEVGRSTDRVPATSMHWVLQTETALHMTSPPSPAVSGGVQIDWVAAWAYEPTAT